MSCPFGPYKSEDDVMRLTCLAMALVALATPAWAFNGSAPATDWEKARDVCTKAGGDQIVCTMRHMPDETQALSIAEDLVSWCGVPNKIAQCPVWRAYIKQRWGY